jgi:hypothetical protein
MKLAIEHHVWTGTAHEGRLRFCYSEYLATGNAFRAPQAAGMARACAAQEQAKAVAGRGLQGISVYGSPKADHILCSARSLFGHLLQAAHIRSTVISVSGFKGESLSGSYSRCLVG